MAKTTLAKTFASQVRAPKTELTKEQLAEKAALATKLNEQAAAEDFSPEFLRQVAADVQSVLDYGFENDNLFSQYYSFETHGEFDRVVIEEERGLTVFSTARGGYVEESTITSQEWEVPRDDMGYHVTENNDKLRANFATTIEKLVSLGGIRLEAEVNRRVFNSLQAAVPSNSPYYTSSAGITQAAVDAGLIGVRDAIKPSFVGRSPITIIGRAAVTNEISNFTGFSPWALEEIRQDGFLGRYKGANVITLDNWTDENDLPFIAGNELWLFGGTVGKFVKFGGVRSDLIMEPILGYTHAQSRLSVGNIVHHPEQSRRLVDTQLSA